MSDNARLERAIEALAGDQVGDAALFRAVLDALLESSLLAAQGDDDQLMLFTSSVELFTYDSGAEQETIAGEDAIRLVAGGDYEGLIINPNGKAFELTREDVEDMFDIDEED